MKQNRAGLRILCALLLVLLLPLLPSCRGKEPPCLPEPPFTCRAAVTRGDRTGTYALSVEEGKIVLSPDDGAHFICTPEGASVRAGGLTLPLDRNMLPDDGLLLAALFPPKDAEYLEGARETDGERLKTFTLVSPSGNLVYAYAGNTLRSVEREGGVPVKIVFDSFSSDGAPKPVPEDPAGPSDAGS